LLVLCAKQFIFYISVAQIYKIKATIVRLFPIPKLYTSCENYRFF